jgi:Kef-type K+ transport system membrane component KefB
MNSPYQEFALLLAVSAFAGFAATRLRQPLIIAYIAVGVAVGPALLGWVSAHGNVDLLAQVGVTVLLFLVGLRLDLQLVRNLGAVALATGLGQLAFTIVIGLALALALGMTLVAALYVAVALTFSSTIIIVKLLSDKRELDSLHGRIAVGFLIVQDIAVVVAMMAIGAPGTAAQPGWTPVLAAAGKLALGAAAVGLLMRYVLPPLLERLAASQELLMLFAVAWGTGLATAGEAFGFSKEVGAFLAGFSLASSPYRDAIGGRLASLRDFLLLFFFIDLGVRLELTTGGEQLWAALAFSAFVLIGNPLIVMAIMGYMGYRKRTGFLAGLTVAQISEFSLMFVAMGVSLGHVGPDTLGLVTIVGLVTIGLSTYMIVYSHPLYERLKPWLGPFERKNPFREHRLEALAEHAPAPQVLVFGVGRYGGRLAEQLARAAVRVLGVDFDPEAVRAASRRGFAVSFGDAEDPDFLASLPLSGARWAVAALPDAAANVQLLHALRRHGYAGRVALTARDERDAGALRRSRPDLVLMPFSDAADLAAETLRNDLARRHST